VIVVLDEDGRLPSNESRFNVSSSFTSTEERLPPLACLLALVLI